MRISVLVAAAALFLSGPAHSFASAFLSPCAPWGMHSSKDACQIIPACENDQRLQSAFILRTNRTVAKPSWSPQPLALALQRHFDVVIERLEEGTPSSIELALARLENRSNDNWSEAERIRWRERLSALRNLQIEHLRAYRDRAVFPRNEGQATGAAPIFVDRHGSDCAVGYLMRVSGWGGAVDAIAAKNNLVYVTDVSEGPLVDWIAQSGLTQEEAALIQPGYFPEMDLGLSELLEPGASIEHEGIRWENFSFSVENYHASLDWQAPPASICELVPELCDPPPPDLTPTNEGTLPNPDYAGALLGDGFFQPGPDYLPMLTPVGTHWAWVSLQGRAPEAMAQRIQLAFDVVATSPGTWIDQVTIHSLNLQGGLMVIGPDDALSSVRWIAAVYGENGRLGEASIDDRDTVLGLVPGISTVDFAKQRRIRVEQDVLLVNRARVDSLILDVNMAVPEPSGTVLVLIGAAVGLCRVMFRAKGGNA